MIDNDDSNSFVVIASEYDLDLAGYMDTYKYTSKSKALDIAKDFGKNHNMRNILLTSISSL